METLRNNWLKVLALILLIVLICLIPKCQNEPKQSINDFKPLIQKRDSIIKVVEYRDSIRIVYKDKWRKIKYTDTIPCETLYHKVVAVCDTLIVKDSLLISEQGKLIKQDSVIIYKAFNRISSDSTQIALLQKKLKRQKLFTKLSFGAGVIVGGALMYRK